MLYQWRGMRSYSVKADVGGDEEDRTPDLRIANATLSQLSYVPTARFMIMRKACFDNPTDALVL
jgi:hypothetical protein